MPLDIPTRKSLICCEQGIVFMRDCIDDSYEVPTFTDAEVAAYKDLAIADTLQCDLGDFDNLQWTNNINEDEQSIKSGRKGSLKLKESAKTKSQITYDWLSCKMITEWTKLSGGRTFTVGADQFSVNIFGLCRDKPFFDFTIVECDDQANITDVQLFSCYTPGGSLSRSYADFCETGEVSESPIELNGDEGASQIGCSPILTYDNKGSITDALARSSRLQSVKAGEKAESPARALAAEKPKEYLAVSTDDAATTEAPKAPKTPKAAASTSDTAA